MNCPLAGEVWRFLPGRVPGFGLGGRIIVLMGRRFSKGSGTGDIFILFLLKSSVVSVGAFSTVCGLWLTFVNVACRTLWIGLGVGSASLPLDGTSNIFPPATEAGEEAFDFGIWGAGFDL
jgi:hypothetical protein